MAREYELETGVIERCPKSRKLVIKIEYQQWYNNDDPLIVQFSFKRGGSVIVTETGERWIDIKQPAPWVKVGDKVLVRVGFSDFSLYSRRRQSPFAMHWCLQKDWEAAADEAKMVREAQDHARRDHERRAEEQRRADENRRRLAYEADEARRREREEAQLREHAERLRREVEEERRREEIAAQQREYGKQRAAEHQVEFERCLRAGDIEAAKAALMKLELVCEEGQVAHFGSRDAAGMMLGRLRGRYKSAQERRCGRKIRCIN